MHVFTLARVHTCILAIVHTACVMPPDDAVTELRVCTLNIAHGQVAGADEIAAALVGADVVGLQEVDVMTARSGFHDQAGELAEAAGLHVSFGAAIELEGGSYGVGLLSRWPIDNAVVVDVSGDRASDLERRVMLRADVLGLGVAVVHTSWDGDDRDWQSVRVLSSAAGADVLLADLNAGPGELGYEALRAGGWHDAAGWSPTYPSSAPRRRIDHVLVSGRVEVVEQAAPVDVVVSDHLPVCGVIGLR